MYTKFSLSLRYFPDLIDNPDAAVHRLRYWIDNCAPLSKALAETGYKRTNKSFTKKQVDLIIEYLGDP